MVPKNIAKILAKLINMYRAGYVKAAQMGGGQTSIESAILRAIIGSKKLSPSSKTINYSKITENYSKMAEQLMSGSKLIK